MLIINIMSHISKHKNRAWQRYLETRSPDKYRDYTKARNKLRKLTRKAAKEVERQISNNAKSNPKGFWRHVRDRLKTNTDVANLVDRRNSDVNCMADTDQGKAEVLAHFFSSVYTREPLDDLPTPTPRPLQETLTNMVISKEEMLKKLNTLKIDKSPGPDGIHPRLLRELANEISEALAHISNDSLSSESLPEDWKQAQISAIHKKGSRSEPGNYRPVSLTSIACKITESIIRDKILNHLRTNDLLSNRQYGFVGRRSTALQLLKILDDWSQILDEGGELDVVYTDFMKAFDTVPHRRLLKKLQSYGVQGKVLSWIGAFLIGRTQRVAVKGTYSSWSDVLSGIPQGSVLGPLLFIIYINELPEITKSQLYMFADDCKLYRRIQDNTDQATLQGDISKLQE